MAQIKELELKIIKHKNLYYQGKPKISDFEYDAIEDELRALDPKNPVLDIIGTSILTTDKVEHNEKMLSLGKTYSQEELTKWCKDNEIISTFKIDGSSCSLIYESGRLSLGKTRGDGKFGENITSKVLCLSSIPKLIQEKSNVEIRGEVYCTQEKFFKLSKEMESLGLDKPSSQRNIVAGILGRKENIELARFLDFQAFELISENELFKTEEEKFNFLKKINFSTPEFKMNKSSEDISLRITESREFMTSGEYLIDGIVFTYNSIALHKELGSTAHHPRYKMAFKFQGETKISKIESISWQVSRNGYLTPVANINPVELSGAMVGRVTLHNFGMVEQNQVKIGDEIELVRSGEVIPKFLRVVTKSEELFDYPKKCPSCKGKVSREEIRLVCYNDLCPDKIKDNILNYIQKIGIDDLSSKRLEEMIKENLVLDIPSLYELKMKELLKLDKVKEKLATKLLDSIKKSKDADLVTFLAALGIKGGAYNKCEKVVLAGANTLVKIRSLTIPMLVEVDSFAEKSATEFINSLKEKSGMIDKLEKLGFNPKAKAIKINKYSEISGKTFCITGTLTMKRSELQKLIKDNGGVVQSSVTSKTNYLVTNDVESSSSKFLKAKKLSLPIINEEALFKLISF